MVHTFKIFFNIYFIPLAGPLLYMCVCIYSFLKESKYSTLRVINRILRVFLVGKMDVGFLNRIP